MKVPPNALIRRDKLTQYLLVHRPKDDKSQYLMRIGFDQSNPDALEAAIRHATAENEAAVSRASEYGISYTVHCKLAGPMGELPVNLVWLHRLDGVFAFVTLVPD